MVAPESAVARPSPSPERDRTSRSLIVIALAIVAAALARPLLADRIDVASVQAWATVFVSICIQAFPFLVLGVTVSGALAAFVPPGALARIVPRHPVLGVPLAAVAGVALPGCECGSVPIAGRLIACGAPPPAALAFLLAAPAINPVVLVATAVAFPGRPAMVAARALASVLAATAVGLVWAARGRDDWVARVRAGVPDQRRRLDAFLDTARHDLVHAGGFLVVGGATAATLQTVVPRSVLDSVAGTGVLAVLTLAVLAFVLAICSEADAFVAAGLSQFSWTARLTFLVVGPMVDVKLVALQAGTFGRPFAARFAPLTFVAAVASASLVGWWLL